MESGSLLPDGSDSKLSDSKLISQLTNHNCKPSVSGR